MKYLLGLILLLCVSCSTVKTVEVPIETIRTEYVNKVETKYDSIYLKDSINTYIKNDTVFIEKYRDRYKYRDIVRVDTICKTDSILTPVYIETIKEVNKIKWYLNLLIYLGIGALALLGFNIIKAIRKYLGK